MALTAAGRIDDAIALYGRIAAAFPDNPLSFQNLAAALVNAGRWADSEMAVRKSLKLQPDARNAQLILARALLNLGRLDEAEANYLAALSSEPSDAAVHRELVQLRWMRDGDIYKAMADLDLAIQREPSQVLRLVKAQALGEAGDAVGAFALMREVADAAPRNAELAIYAAQSAVDLGEVALALSYGERAMTTAPRAITSHIIWIKALLVAGEAARASAAAQVLRQGAPTDQLGIALQATAWRMLGDPRYWELYDYDAFVCVDQLETPPGWPNLTSYLSDLAAALNEAHHFRAHPFSQSIKQGSQASYIESLAHPAARALQQALDAPIRRIVNKLGRGDDPLRRRNTGGYRSLGVWSIRMRAGGRHVNHVHPQGWLSSACYVETPNGAGGHREGWIKFGEPSMPLTPPLEAEHFVEPLPGRLVLFPSYMWHGTLPFTGDGVRLAFAFDLVPG